MVNLYRNSSVWDRNERIRQNDNWEKVEDWINGNMDGDVFQEWFNQNALSIEGAWDNTKEYEGLSIVTYQGNSYTSKKRVPVGIDINNEEYWTVTGNYDAQVEYYRRDVEQVKQDMTDVDNRLTDDMNDLKKKLTDDDGTLMTYSNFDFNTEVESVKTKDFYVTTSVNHPPNVSYNGFVQVRHRNGGNQIQVTYTPYNSNQIFMRLKNDTWGDWVEVGTPTSDTGWIEFDLINGAEQNTAFMAPGDGGFKCSYRTITNGTHVKKLVRLNGRNVTSGQTIGKLPDGFVGVAQSQYIRTPLGRTSSGGLITIRPDGNIKFYVINENGWLESDYFYGEISWDEYSKK